jgi:hypothetical protein
MSEHHAVGRREAVFRVHQMIVKADEQEPQSLQ